MTALLSLTTICDSSLAFVVKCDVMAKDDATHACSLKEQDIMAPTRAVVAIAFLKSRMCLRQPGESPMVSKRLNFPMRCESSKSLAWPAHRRI